ncbi:RHS repeat-associated core domain-containing protein [Shewanella japonica]|uniref:Fibronectin type-III domain-containing protein n=1 Tax=Shewanella japonica TaxID=93973 RepID=A0ABN4YKQ5_9GAMM|nr:RHS repeat-associated core domain-containing protein [Shewanella japonica]ARD24080.1 hypothetical protein SJ2017_3847 [Shewanella japonica]
MKNTSWMMKLLVTVFYFISFGVIAAPGGWEAPATPLLSGTKLSSGISLNWNAADNCSSFNFEIEESINNSTWVKVFNGTGKSDGVAFSASSSNASNLTSSSTFIGGGCVGTGNIARTTYLSGRSGPVYYYRIRACLLGACSQYSSPLQLGAPLSFPTPASITVPTGTVNGEFLIKLSKVTGALKYEVQQQFNNGGWVNIYSGNNIAVGVTPSNSGSYKYRVKACSSAICSGWRTSSTVTVILPPSNPTSITVPPSDNNGAYSISWSSVSGTTYNLYEKKNNGSWSLIKSSTTALSFSVSGRTNGTYKYLIRACKSGICSSGKESSSVTVLFPPQTTPVIVPTNIITTGTYDVSWKRPSTATFFNLQEKLGNQSWRSIGTNHSGLTYRISGRESGTNGYRVRACNSSGCSAWSDTRNVTVMHTPSTPTNINVPTTTVKNGSIVINWTAVAEASQYTLQESKNNSSWATVSNSITATSYTRTGRGNGNYKYRVRGCNAGSCGGYKTSGNVTVFLPPAAPSQVTVPSSTSFNGSILIGWNASSTTTKYTLQELKSGGSWTTVSSSIPSTTTSYNRTARTTGKYNYRVKACNSSGCSGYKTSSATYVVKTPSSISVPANDVDGAYTVSWAAVSGATSYQLEQKVGSGSWTSIYSGTSLSKAVSGLGTNQYQYRVKAKYGSLSGGYRTSAATYVVKTPSSISVPANDVDGAYTVSWAAVSGATSYQLEQKIGSGSWTSIYTGSGLSKGVSGLGSNQYQYRVKAKYGSVSGSYRTSAATYVVKTPSSISVPANDVDGAYTVSWAAVSGATSYQLEQKIGGGSWTSIYTGSGLSKGVSGLGSNQYQYRVKAKYGSVSGSYRTSAATYVVKTPSSISVPANDVDGAYSVSWAAVSGATSYQLEQKIGGGSWTSIYTGSGLSKGVSGLGSNQYQYRVKAKYGSVSGLYKTSSVMSVLLPPVTPITISVPTTIVTNRNIGIQWSDVTSATSYNLQQSINNGAWLNIATQSTNSFEQQVEADGEYKYKVNACNESGCSGWRVSANITVILPPAWRTTEAATVADAGGSDRAPSEIIDLTAAVLKGKSGVSGGQASYQIPIDLPPGRNGIQPKVSLSYNSQTGNGIAGVGWSLNAGSAISRCGATYAQDGLTRAVTFNSETDRLCLNGQRLITSDDYGTSGAEYRTEMDTFVKVVQSGEINSASTSFSVHRPDGSVATYGGTANSRSVPQGLSTTLNWKLSKESWSEGLNTIDYQYSDSSNGEHLLERIYYTGTESQLGSRSIKFNYEERGDIRISYLGGGKISALNRLSSIEVYQNSNDWISQYDLAYKSSQSSNRSLLNTVIHCAKKDGLTQCLPANNINWQDHQYISEPTAITFGEEIQFENVMELNEFEPIGDTNGDGVLDWKGFNTNAETEIVNQNNLSFDNTCKYKNDIAQYTCISFDADNDGITDLYKIKNDYLYINLSKDNRGLVNTNIQLEEMGSVGVKSERILAAQDFNGDGWVDLAILRFNNKGWESPVVYLHTGEPNQPFNHVHQNLYQFDRTNDFYSTFVGDIDGNGLSDILVSKSTFYDNRRNKHSHPNGEPSHFLLNKSTPTSIIFEEKAINESVRLGLSRPINEDKFEKSIFHYLIDINGDGRQDFLSWDTGYLGAHINNGRGEFLDVINLGAFFNTRSYDIDVNKSTNGEPDNRTISYPRYYDALRIGDVDGDGINELLVPGERVVKACTEIYDGYPTQKLRTICGASIYGSIEGPDNTTSLIQANKADRSIYQYDAIFFDVTELNDVNATRKSTQFFGGVQQTNFIDAFGDGLLDSLFVYQKPNAAFWYEDIDSRFGTKYGAYISRNRGAVEETIQDSSYQPTDFLASVTDGIGNQSSWRYRPLSTGEASAGQTKMYQTDHEYVGDGYIHFGSSMYVVQSFEQSNGIGGSNKTEYGYKGAMYNLQGRGFTGFREIIEKDIARNKTVQSVFKQKFPEVSLLESQTVKVGGTTVAQTTNIWADNPQHSINGVYHNVNTQSLIEHYGLSGSSEQRSSTLQTVDATDVTENGNIKKRTQTVTDYIDGGANSYRTIVETNYTPDIDSWFLGKFADKTTKNRVTSRDWASDPYSGADAEQSQTMTVDEWHPLHHKPIKVIHTASGSTCDREETTVLNDYGLPTSVTINGSTSDCGAMAARTTGFTYTKDGSSSSSDGYLPYTVTNAKGHATTTKYDMGLGVPTKVTAPNNMITETQYDAIGRPVQVEQTGKPTQYLRYLLAQKGSHAPSHAKLLMRMISAGIPTQEVYSDSLGRQLRSATQAFDGSSYQYVDKRYDSLGRLTHESLPYYDGSQADYTVFSGFDAFDRPSTRSLPNGQSGGLVSTYTYYGLTTDITVEGRTMSRTYGMQGQLYETVDAASGSNRFTYDGAGRPLIIEDANGSQIVASYNGFGHKTQVVDPNQGTTIFGYNTLGELDKQTDANEVMQTFSHDTLGRITAKNITGSNADGSASYTWDTLKQGMLTSETQNGITRNYTYTNVLQLASSSVKVASSVGGDNVTRIISHQYDGFYGRPKGLTYPNGLTLEYRYNDAGYLAQTRNAASQYVYRDITQMDAAGHITGSQMANSLLEQTSDYNSEGTMASTEVSSSLGLLHSHYYDQYDSFMNLMEERNGATGLTKSYEYDELNRLEKYTYSNAGFAIYDNTTPFAATVNYGYDTVGNLLKKTDYSRNTANAYEYNSSCASGSNAGPNAVCAITKLNGSRVQFSYDSRGNLISGDGLTMTYNALDKPLTVVGRGPNNTSTGFVYGSDNMRALQTRTVSGTTTKTHYVDKLFEADNDGSWRAYIGDIALLSYTPERSHQLLYTLRDRLGSATTMVDHQGNIISQRYFDPFGRTATASVAGSLGDLIEANGNRRGFTDHEHLNEQQLIHMNGRVYDYNMGRFMSVDPFIQSPTSTQSVNPYSYIMNNPLSGTDPTGYASETMTGSRIKGVDTGAHGAAFGARIEMGKKKANSGAKKSQKTAKSDAKVSNIGGQESIAQQWGEIVVPM